MFKIEGFVTNENFIGAVGGIPLRRHNYVTNDEFATVEAAGYFNPLRDAGLIRQGDVIEVAGDRDGTPFFSTYVLATVPADGNVTITEAKAVTQNVIQEVTMTGISTKASDAAVLRYVPSFGGTIEKFYSVINGALATGDATLTLAINGDAVTAGAITITQAGSAAGDVDVATPSAAKTFAAGDVITITGGGASTADGTANVTLQLAPATA